MLGCCHGLRCAMYMVSSCSDAATDDRRRNLLPGASGEYVKLQAIMKLHEIPSPARPWGRVEGMDGCSEFGKRGGGGVPALRGALTGTTL